MDAARYPLLLCVLILTAGCLAPSTPEPTCPPETPETAYAIIEMPDGNHYAAALTPDGQVPPTDCWMHPP